MLHYNNNNITVNPLESGLTGERSTRLRKQEIALNDKKKT
jgi:hypothetical protein